MSDSKHTPEPWMAAARPSSVVGWPVVGPEGRLICNLAYLGAKPDHVSSEEWAAHYSEVQANGRLIAAAPGLLEAVKRNRAALDLIDPDRPLQYATTMDLMRKDMDDAIAKATPSDTPEVG